jgi:hypothetical protein
MIVASLDADSVARMARAQSTITKLGADGSRVLRRIGGQIRDIVL